MKIWTPVITATALFAVNIALFASVASAMPIDIARAMKNSAPTVVETVWGYGYGYPYYGYYAPPYYGYGYYSYSYYGYGYGYPYYRAPYGYYRPWGWRRWW